MADAIPPPPPEEVDLSLDTVIGDISLWLEEFGWNYKIVQSPEDPDFKWLFTYYDTHTDNFRIPISVKLDDPFLWVATNKMIKFTDKEKAFHFFELNDVTPGGKWMIYTEQDHYYVNYAFEVHRAFLDKDMIFFELDSLVYNVEHAVEVLKQKGWLAESGLHQTTVITADDFHKG